MNKDFNKIIKFECMNTNLKNECLKIEYSI